MNPTLPGNGQAIEAMTSVLVPLGLLELDHDRIELTEPARFCPTQGLSISFGAPSYWQLMA
jgi:hypothetical protein